MLTINIAVLDFNTPERSDLLRHLDESSWQPDQENKFEGTFAKVSIDDQMQAHLHLAKPEGPQDHWEIFAEAAMGYILVLPCDRPAILPQVAQMVATFCSYTPTLTMPWLIAAQGQAQAAISDAALRDAVGLTEASHVLNCDIQDRDSARDVLRHFLVLLADED